MNLTISRAPPSPTQKSGLCEKPTLRIACALCVAGAHLGLIITLLRTDTAPPAGPFTAPPLFVEFIRIEQPSTKAVTSITKITPARPHKPRTAPAPQAIATSEDTPGHVIEREAVAPTPLVSKEGTPVEPPAVVEAATASPTRELPASPPDLPSAPQLISKVEYMQPPRPVYPTLSRRLREQGEVVLRILITPQGRSAEVTVERTSGSVRLDQAAIAAVYAAVFKPRLENGLAVPAYAFIPIRFEL